ncbi:MAG TPA: RsmE family RNA methyltransferase [Opitutaceae bacterium]
MNLILFEPDEIGSPLERADPRAIHILRVLRRAEGDLFDAGVVGGPRGKATLLSIAAGRLVFRFEPGGDTEPADPIHLAVALPRPQTARKILGEAASLGVASIRFFPSEKGEPGYASSTLWASGEWRRHLVDGAAQAFDTRIPVVFHDAGLAESLSSLPIGCTGIALDNYEATRRLAPDSGRPVALAFGPERGWSASERDLLRLRGFELAHLGRRVLRTETAVVAALAIVKAAV